MDNWAIVEAKVRNIIAILSRKGEGGGAKNLKEELEACRQSESFQDERFQEAADALYQLLTHPRGVSDIFVEEFTLAEWVNLLFDAAKHIEPFIESRKVKKRRRRGRKSGK